MILTKASKISGTIGIFALLITLFIATEAAAQCSCVHHVRHVAHTRARRTVHTRVVTVVRPVYKTIYVPSTRVASYVGYAETPTDRVVVTDRYGNSVANGWGRRDGFKDGWKAALKFHTYDPENNHDFRDADNGYKSQFGSKYLYRTSYREGYVHGYEAGFRAVTGGETYRAVRY